VSVTFVSCVKTNKDIFEIFSSSGSQVITEFYALVNLKSEAAVSSNKKLRCRYMLKLTTDKHEASSGLSATAEFFVVIHSYISRSFVEIKKYVVLL